MAVLDPIRERLRRGSVKRISDAAPQLLRELQDAAPVADDGGGTMRDAISVNPSGLRLDVVVGVEYASFTNADTEPHRIPLTGNGPPLAFEWPFMGPGTFFFAHVDHPGTQGVVDWYGDALDEWPKILERQTVR